jgi:hypothetical protein
MPGIQPSPAKPYIQVPANSIQPPSFFSGHELPYHPDLKVHVREKGYDGFFSLILLAAFIIFVLVRVYSPRKLNQMFGAFVKPAAMNQLLREEYAFSNRSSILLLILYLLIFPLFAFQVFNHFFDFSFFYSLSHTRGIFTYFILLNFVFAMYIVKIMTVQLLAMAFDLRSAGSEYVYTVLLFNKVAGLVMFPLVLLITFAHQFNPSFALYTGLTALAILLIYRMLRLIQIGLSNSGVSILYLFLYLCTLEILPFVVLIKLFMFSFS